MKTLILTIALILIASSAFASTIEYDQAGDAQQVQICLEHSVTQDGKVGAFAYSCLTENWKEGYVGLEYNGELGKKTYFQAAYGLGRETGGNRNGGWLWVGFGKFSAIYLYENGQSGTWDKFRVQYAVNDRLSIGCIKKMYSGEGVYAEYKIGKSLKLAYSGYDTKEFGVNLSFSL